VLRMPVIFGMQVLESALERGRKEAAVYLGGLGGLVGQRLQSFHYRFPQDLSDLGLVTPVESIVLGLGLDSCILTLYRHRIMNQ
jgi:hypothetical protein